VSEEQQGKTYAGLLQGEGYRFGIVVGRFNEFISGKLLSGALDCLLRHGTDLKDVEVAWVPGAFEIPLVAGRMAKSGKYDAVVCLGAVIRGGTPHFDYVCDAATAGLTRVALDTGVPVGFGLLTCDDEAQALERSGLPGSHEDKGYEAAAAAVATVLALRALDSPPVVGP
jgi:6,7-dimethyl-8-ribityllumazine synthase